MRWQKCFGGSKYDDASSLIQTSDGGYLIAGSTNSQDGDVSGWHGGDSLLNSQEWTDAWVVKLNSLGTLQWQKCLGGTSEDKAYSLIQSHEDDYIIAGISGSTDGDLTGRKLHDGASWIVRLNDSGGIVWQNWYQGQAYSIVKTSDGGYAFAGINNIDAMIVKLGPDTGKASVESSSYAQSSVSIYPNPSSNEVHFISSNLSINAVGFYDMMGRQHFPSYNIASNSITCDVHDFPNGIYMARMNWTGHAVWGDKIIPKCIYSAVYRAALDDVY